MDISNYQCKQTIEAYKYVLKNKLSLPNPIGFVGVKNQNKFDISSYNGKFPAGVVLNGNCVIGWTNDKTPTNIFELEPHKSNPKKGYYWSKRIPYFELSYSKIIYRLNHRCTQLLNPDKVIFDNLSTKFFEDSRHILWDCVLHTKCIPLERLIELEVRYMNSVVGDDILIKCQELYGLESPTTECMEKWIRWQYENMGLSDNVVYKGLFNNVERFVTEILT